MQCGVVFAGRKAAWALGAVVHGNGASTWQDGWRAFEAIQDRTMNAMG